MQSHRHAPTQLLTHTQAHTHKQDTFLVLFRTTSTSGKRGFIKVWTDTDYWLKCAESPTSEGGNSWTQRRRGKTSYWPENNEMTDTPSSVLSINIWTGSTWRASVFLWLVTSGNTAVHLMAFHMSVASTWFLIYTVQQRTTASTGVENHTNCLSAKTERVSFSCPSWRWIVEKTCLRNGSTCLMLVNKYHALDVAGEEPYGPDLFTLLQEKNSFSSSPAVKNDLLM